MEEQVVANLVAKVGVHAEAQGLEHILGKLEFLKKAVEGFILVAAVHKLYEVGESLAALGEGLESSAIQTGLTTDRLQELQYAATQNAVSADALTAALSRLGRLMFQAQKGSKGAVDSFARLGISPEQLKQFSSLDEALFAVQDGIAGLSTQQEKLAVTQQIFGRGGARFLKFLGVGSAETKELMQRAKTVGAVIREQNVKALAEFEDANSSIKLVFRDLTANIVGFFIPILTKAMRAFEGMWGGIQGPIVNGAAWLGRHAVYWSYVAYRWLDAIIKLFRNRLFGPGGIGSALQALLDGAMSAVGGFIGLYKRFLKLVLEPVQRSEFANGLLDLLLELISAVAQAAGGLLSLLGAIFNIGADEDIENHPIASFLRQVGDLLGDAFHKAAALVRLLNKLYGFGGVAGKILSTSLLGTGSAAANNEELKDILDEFSRGFSGTRTGPLAYRGLLSSPGLAGIAVPNLAMGLNASLRPPPRLQLDAALTPQSAFTSNITVNAQSNSSPEQIAQAIARMQRVEIPKMLGESRRDFQSQLRW